MPDRTTGHSPAPCNGRCNRGYWDKFLYRAWQSGLPEPTYRTGASDKGISCVDSELSDLGKRYRLAHVNLYMCYLPAENSVTLTCYGPLNSGRIPSRTYMGRTTALSDGNCIRNQTAPATHSAQPVTRDKGAPIRQSPRRRADYRTAPRPGTPSSSKPSRGRQRTAGNFAGAFAASPGFPHPRAIHQKGNRAASGPNL